MEKDNTKANPVRFTPKSGQQNKKFDQILVKITKHCSLREEGHKTPKIGHYKKEYYL